MATPAPSANCLPISGAQILLAAWNAGELGSTPGPPIWTKVPPLEPLWTVGSGKSGTPCARMHLAIASAAFCKPGADSAVEPPLPGSWEWQVCIADWNAGALTGTPLTVIVWPDPVVCLAWIRMPPAPLPAGSGKFGTPCARMHFENAIGESFVTAVPAEPVEPVEPVELGVLLELPQAAISRPAASKEMGA